MIRVRFATSRQYSGFQDPFDLGARLLLQNLGLPADIYRGPVGISPVAIAVRQFEQLQAMHSALFAQSLSRCQWELPCPSLRVSRSAALP